MVLATPKGAVYEIQGQSATSYEWNVARAFDKLGLAYMFQFQILGGRTRRGGIILDFLVFTVPLSTPCWVQGEYWHSDELSTSDKLEQAIVSQMSDFAPAVILWGQQVKTEEDALQAVKSAFHL